MLNLIHGYHQRPLHEDCRPCTAMSSPLGPMQWKLVPLGAKNENASLQRLMEDLLQPVRDCEDPVMDDIINVSGTEDMTRDELIKAHEKDLRQVLGVSHKHSKVCNPKKASGLVGELLGKLAAVRHWEKPQTISQLRSFI